MDMGETDEVTQSNSIVESEIIESEQDDIDPDSAGQLNSLMSSHEGGSTSMDPCTNGMELSKSPVEE